MSALADGNRIMIRVMLGVICAIVLAYGGWVTDKITDDSDRITRLETHYASVKTLLQEIKSQTEISNAQVIRRLERIEDRLTK